MMISCTTQTDLAGTLVLYCACGMLEDMEKILLLRMSAGPTSSNNWSIGKHITFP